MTTLLHDGLILDHASGTAPAAVSALAVAQAELRPDAARRIGVAEAAFGALMEAGPRARLDPDSYARLLAALESTPTPQEARPALEPGGDGAIPEVLRRALTSQGGPLHWSPRLGGRAHIRIESLCERGVEAELIRLDPGRSIPSHDHAGEEYTLVLTGGFSDMRGHYGLGDVCAAEPGTLHRPKVDPHEACLCFAVSLGRMKFRNPLIAAYDRFFTPHP